MRMLWSDRQAPAGNRGGGPVKSAAVLMDEDGECAEIAATAVPPIAVARAAGGALCELHFWVRYSLLEYVSFMWEHTGYLIHRRRIRWPASLYMRLRSTATAGFHFMMLRRGRRTYEVAIDGHGIVRTSDTGVTLIEWDDVSGVRTYSRGLMMVLNRGTLPIPFRCLKGDEAEMLRALVTEHKGGAAAH
jgi:hypothetical protein